MTDPPAWLRDSVASLVQVIDHPLVELKGRRVLDARVIEVHEYRDVPFIIHGPGFGIIHEGKLLLFPWDRMYGVYFEGDTKDRILDVVRVMTEDQKRTIEGVRRSQEIPERM